MRRRDFIKVVAGSAITWPPAARGQQNTAQIARTGIIDRFVEIHFATNCTNWATGRPAALPNAWMLSQPNW
jgi:hypothetical protein